MLVFFAGAVSGGAGLCFLVWLALTWCAANPGSFKRDGEIWPGNKYGLRLHYGYDRKQSLISRIVRGRQG